MHKKGTNPKAIKMAEGSPFFACRRKSTIFVSDAMPALWIHPSDIVGRTSNSAGAALDTIFKSYCRNFQLFLPFIHIGRAKEVAVFGHTFQAIIRLFDHQVRLGIAFVTNRK
jgi:hypothetical protein